jgi:hypothetical protein
MGASGKEKEDSLPPRWGLQLLSENANAAWDWGEASGRMKQSHHDHDTAHEAQSCKCSVPEAPRTEKI